METWYLILVSLCISALVRAILNLQKPTPNLPPGPPNFPIISNILWLRKSFADLEEILRRLKTKYGPMVTLRLGSRVSIFVADRSVAHEALVQNGALFADRPRPLPTDDIVNTHQHNINSSSYGPNWRILRRNLTGQILHPSRIKSYSNARKWVLQVLLNRLHSQANAGAPVPVMENLQHAMFCLLTLMCFGEKVEQNQIEEVERVERAMLKNVLTFNILNFFPSLTKILLRKKWAQLLQLRKDQEDVLIPLIRARKKASEERSKDEEDENNVLCYVDTLLNIELPEEKRKLTDPEMVTLCNEFLNGGVDTTATTLEWIMANLVKNPFIQEKLFMEINGVVEDRGGQELKEIKEEDLQKMTYLKAVILEGLRRHPPGHFVLPHAVTEDVKLDKYVLPKNATINFMVAEIGRDPKVWEDPMTFKPERFLDNTNGEEEAMFDITGSREIKMMPFGAGRRICPGYGLAMLHLEYFLANLVWSFEWKAMEGVDDVDLSERQEFTVVMKNPLLVRIIPRFHI